MQRLLAVTGFGAFEDVGRNPSGLLARALAERPPAPWRVVAQELPVSFERAPSALEAFLSALPARPDLLLSLGVHRDPGFRLEERARGAPHPEGERTRRDVDGRTLAEVVTSPDEHRSTLPVEALALELAVRTGVQASHSRDAGGYVCERTYHRLLARGARDGIPALFVHVPPLRHESLERQEEVLRGLLGILAERC